MYYCWIMCVFECILVEVKRQLFCFHLAVGSGHWAYEANTLPAEPSCWPNLYSWVLRLGVRACREECLSVYLYVSSFPLFEIRTENIILVYTYGSFLHICFFSLLSLLCHLLEEGNKHFLIQIDFQCAASFS